MKAKRFLRKVFAVLVKLFGARLTDQRTGEEVARALMVCWRGRIYLLGYEGKDQVMPVFLAQEKMRFWKREIGFATHPRPDFPHDVPTEPSR